MAWPGAKITRCKATPKLDKLQSFFLQRSPLQKQSQPKRNLFLLPQVGSSTWAEQLLRLKGVSIGPTTPIHKVTSHQSNVWWASIYSLKSSWQSRPSLCWRTRWHITIDMNLSAKRWLGGLRLRKESLFLLWGILLKDSCLPMRCFYRGSLSMNLCIAVSKWFLLEYDHYCGPGQTVQTEDTDKIRPNFRTPSLEFPPLWNHPAKNSSQVLGGNECTKR